VTTATERRVVPPIGVAIHRSANPETAWRFARGVPPHTFAEETVVDLVHAATDLDDVIAHVTRAFARNLTSEDRLRREAATSKKLRWRADLDEIIPRAAGGAHSVLEYRTTATLSKLTGSRPPASRRGSPSQTAARAVATATTRSTA